jgi:hypothetical protein
LKEKGVERGRCSKAKEKRIGRFEIRGVKKSEDIRRRRYKGFEGVRRHKGLD